MTLSTRLAFGVPVPFSNCGRPTDIVSLQLMDASVWPPVGTPAPLKASVGQTITSADALLTLTFEGNPGFPVHGGSGAYHATVQVSQSTGQAVFCATFPLADISFVAAPSVSVPTLSGATLFLMAGLLAAAGLLALRQRGI